MCRFFAIHEKKEKKEPKKRKKSKLLVNCNLRDARPQAKSKHHALNIGPIGPTVQQTNAIKCNGLTIKRQKPNNPKNAPFLHFYFPTLSNYTYFTLSFKNTPVLRLIIENRTQQHPPGVGMGG